MKALNRFTTLSSQRSVERFSYNCVSNVGVENEAIKPRDNYIKKVYVANFGENNPSSLVPSQCQAEGFPWKGIPLGRLGTREEEIPSF